MSKKSKPTKNTAVPQGAPKGVGQIGAKVDGLIQMLGHVNPDGNMCSKINWDDSDEDALNAIKLVFIDALTLAIKKNDLPSFRQSYGAFRDILLLDMESFDTLKFTVAGSDEFVMSTPSELALGYCSWSIYLEVFKQSLDGSGRLDRAGLDSPLQLIFRIGSWLKDSAGEAFYPEIEVLANELVAYFLKAIEPNCKDRGVPLQHACQGLPFLAVQPALNQIFLDQIAAFPA